MLRIVTDGAADLPTNWLEQYEIDFLPVNIHFGEKTFIQNLELDNEGFYRLVDEHRRIPKTSQPSPHQFSEFYKKIAQPGETILSIHVTSKLSGTFASAVAAGMELSDQFRVIPFDSMAGSAGIGFLCREARLLDRAGLSVDEIVARLEVLRQHIQVVLTLDTLEYARMSGRVGTIQAFMASMLNLKPMIALKDGALEIVGRVRTRHAALNSLLEMARAAAADRLVDIVVVHARDQKSGAFLMEQVKPLFRLRELWITDLSISVAANLGPGTVGLVLFPVEQDV